VRRFPRTVPGPGAVIGAVTCRHRGASGEGHAPAL